MLQAALLPAAQVHHVEGATPSDEVKAQEEVPTAPPRTAQGSQESTSPSRPGVGHEAHEFRRTADRGERWYALARGQSITKKKSS